MRSERRVRRLVDGEGTAHRWTVRHRHAAGVACREVLTLYREGVRTRIVFRSGAGRLLPDGLLHSGCVGDGGGELLNLHRPGVVRAFVDEARERGLLDCSKEVDGWELFPAVAVRWARASPAVRTSGRSGP
ncbi:hypothetical protein ACFY0F_01645 [Streptomyces sp. NPDC001544]|uniref:hypothetical protein n=1 Tax=Streptomyces sp. NPDC001544 TaxID=3364584 RepID=UPI00368A46F9